MGILADMAFRNFVSQYGEDALNAVSDRLVPFAKECARGAMQNDQVRTMAFEILRDVLHRFYDPSVVDQAIEPFAPKSDTEGDDE